MGGCDLFRLDVTTFLAGVGGCGYLCPFLAEYGCDLLLAGCEWVWVGMIYFWLDMGGCG